MKINVRKGTRADRAPAVRMMRDFLNAINWHAGPIAIEFDAARAEQLYLHHASRDDAIALVLEVDDAPCGVLLAQYAEHPFGAGRIAMETAWWIDPGARGIGAAQVMLSAYEAWACERACGYVSMSSLDDRVNNILARAGYLIVETRFAKRL